MGRGREEGVQGRSAVTRKYKNQKEKRGWMVSFLSRFGNEFSSTECLISPGSAKRYCVEELLAYPVPCQ